MKEKKGVVYTDGSFNPKTYAIGCAAILYDGTSKRPYRIFFGKKLKAQRKHGSNIAEMVAVRTAIKASISNGYTHIVINHDWTGVDFFSHVENIMSRSKICPEFIKYANYIENARSSIEIVFVKVKAHSDDEKNRIVDKLARSQLKTYSN
jgi:ribonuclease H-related protein